MAAKEPRKPNTPRQNAESRHSNLQVLLDVGLKIRAEYGTARMQLAEILDLQARGLVELERAPDGFVDLFIEDEKIARGEVLAMNNRYAVRITEIVQERRERPQFSPPPRHPMNRKNEGERSRIEDLISLDKYRDEDNSPPSKVHETSIADAYEFPVIDDTRTRRDDPSMGPIDPGDNTYSPRRSVPKPPDSGAA